MIRLALDAASVRCTVALDAGGTIHARQVDGHRRHTREVLGLITELLAEAGGSPRDIGRVLTGDGPGSFTGLRVAAAVAKALCWDRPEVRWATAPSLLIRAAAHAPLGGGIVLALADALRGELYAGWWRVEDGAIETVAGPIRTVRPAELATKAVDLVVGSIPEALVPAVREATGREPLTGEDALPDARALLTLDHWRGGVTEITDPSAWQPVYGRPAEAQAVWERTHGRALPDPSYHPG